MAFTRVNLMHVERLCGEVDSLCHEVRAEMNATQKRYREQFGDPSFELYTPHPSPTTGELRRRSMDLTRALAQLRNPSG